MTFSINHGSKRGLNLMIYILGMKYGERPGKKWINRSDEMDISKSDIFWVTLYFLEIWNLDKSR